MMTRPQRVALVWLTGAALAALVMTLAGQAALSAIAVPAPAPQHTAGAGI
ncbi:MAG: hypothetical protein U0P30_18380 [Vicinamibacterales bacterium]